MTKARSVFSCANELHVHKIAIIRWRIGERKNPVCTISQPARVRYCAQILSVQRWRITS